MTGLQVGYLLYSSSTVYSVITAINASTLTITVNDTKVWPVAPITVYKNIKCEVEYIAQHFDNPAVMKHFQEVELLFRTTDFLNGTVSFFTDLSGGYTPTTFFGSYGGSAWGLFAWGSTFWGGAQRPKPIRIFVSREKSRGSVLSVKVTMANAYSKWALNGISVGYEWVSERTTR